MRGKMHSRRRKGIGVLAGGLVLLVMAAGCGSGGSKSTASAGATSGSTATPVSPAWQQTIDAAKKEGSVTIYSSQGLDQLNVLRTEFQRKYGIDVVVVRGIDGDLQTKVEAEKQTGHGIADMWVNASQSVVQAKAAQAAWFVPATGPDFNVQAYNRTVSYHQGDYFEVGAAILTFGWNTQLYPKGLKDYTDLLDPALKGKIGVIKPTAASIVDFYLYLEQNYGTDFVTKLAAQKPRIYPSSLPMGQALASGEISAGSFVQVQTDAKKTGAPVESGLAAQSWGARFFGMVLKTAPHPNAAQLLADFMITPPGQAAVCRLASSVLPNIPGTVTDNSKVRTQDLSALTTDKVTAYEAKWNAEFK